MSDKTGPTCVRLSDDVRAAATAHAEASGVSLSEWIRELVYRAVYNEPMGADQGYLHGRNIGYRVATIAMRLAASRPDIIPDNIEDGARFLQEQSAMLRRGETG